MLHHSKTHLTAVLTLALAFVFGASVSPVYAKNKENCHSIGGKWLPGSTTNLEKGACLFLISASKSSTTTSKTRAANGVIAPDECTRQGGKISSDKTQCSIEMRSGHHITLLR